MNPSVSLKNLRGIVVGLECINLKPAHREKQGINLYKTHLKRKNEAFNSIHHLDDCY
jgi:hypothetical protein